MYPAAVTLWMGIGTAGAASFEDGYGEDPRTPLTYPFDKAAPMPDHDRGFDMELGVRVRQVSVPASILDVWYFDEDDPGWAYTEGRPRIRGTAVGLEYLLSGPTANGIFYAEWVDSAMEDGYWDDLEEPADHLDGDYLAPSQGMGMVAVGADYAYEARLVKSDQTGGRFGLGFLIGGGLGMGALVGRLDRWGPDDAGNPGYKRFLDGLPADDDKEVPRVFPMVDVSTGLRFRFGDRVSWRVEGGLHTLLYYGTSVGVSF